MVLEAPDCSSNNFFMTEQTQDTTVVAGGETPVVAPVPTSSDKPADSRAQGGRGRGPGNRGGAPGG